MKNINTFLDKCKKFTIQETSEEFITLNTTQESALIKRLNSLKDLKKANSIKILFRGIKEEYLIERLNHSKNSITLEKLFSRLFYFGDKALTYFQNNEEDINKSKWLKNINDNSKDNAEKLFKQIKKVLSSNRKDIENFKEGNECFANYFQKNDTKGAFVEQICGNISFRDYYLFFLHTYGRSGTNQKTLFVSTTSSLNTAKKFGDDEYIICYICPSINPCLNVKVDSSVEDELEELGLPIYSGARLFPDQNEISIRGCLFPHLIWFVIDIKEKRTIINPHMFTNTDTEEQDLTSPFLKINQDEFDTMIRETCTEVVKKTKK